MSKASRFRKSLIHRKQETLQQYILRARDDGLWPDETAKEGVLVWLNTYDSVRFGGTELSEGEFLATMKLVYFLLMEMKPSSEGGGRGRGVEGDEFAVDSIGSSSSSSSFSLDSESIASFGEGQPLSRRSTRQNAEYRSDVDVLKQMESLLSAPRRSIDSESLVSMIDHGSVLEQVIDREVQDRRSRGGRLGEREGSIIYYDVDD